jgi:hypothetical protein
MGFRNEQPPQPVDPPPVAPPQGIIAVQLWDVTLHADESQLADATAAELAARVARLPVVVDSRDVVRELIARLKAAGLVEQCREVRMSIIDGQTGTVQTSAREPQVTSTAVNAQGERTNVINYLSAGTSVSISPKLEADGVILVRLEISDNEIEKSPEVAVAETEVGRQILADRIVNRQVSTIVRVRSGAAVLVQSESTEADGAGAGFRAKLILLGALATPAM